LNIIFLTDILWTGETEQMWVVYRAYVKLTV